MGQHVNIWFIYAGSDKWFPNALESAVSRLYFYFFNDSDSPYVNFSSEADHSLIHL